MLICILQYNEEEVEICGGLPSPKKHKKPPEIIITDEESYEEESEVLDDSPNKHVQNHQTTMYEMYAIDTDSDEDEPMEICKTEIPAQGKIQEQQVPDIRHKKDAANSESDEHEKVEICKAEVPAHTQQENPPTTYGMYAEDTDSDEEQLEVFNVGPPTNQHTQVSADNHADEHGMPFNDEQRDIQFNISVAEYQPNKAAQQLQSTDMWKQADSDSDEDVEMFQPHLQLQLQSHEKTDKKQASGLQAELMEPKADEQVFDLTFDDSPKKEQLDDKPADILSSLQEVRQMVSRHNS